MLELLQVHLQQVRHLHNQDLERGYGLVYLPFALERKYSHADRDWFCNLLFPRLHGASIAGAQGCEDDDFTYRLNEA